MAVTYAWKIDSQLYSYIANPTCINEDGALKPEYILSSNTYMGYVSTVKISDVEEGRLKLYCKSKFTSTNEFGLDSYTTHFNRMMDKIHAQPGYLYVDLLSPDKYFNVDSDCGNLEGPEGQPAIIDYVLTDFKWSDGSEVTSGASFNVEVKSIDKTYDEYSESELYLYFTQEELDKISVYTYEYPDGTVGTGWTYDASWFNDNRDLLVNPNELGTPDYIEDRGSSDRKYYVKRDTDSRDNKYGLKFSLVLPKQESVSGDSRVTKLETDVASLSSTTKTLETQVNNIIGILPSGQLVVITDDNWTITFSANNN